MNVTCPDCRSIFRVDPAKVPLGGVRARCSVCGGVIAVAAPEFATAGATDAPARPAERFTPPPIAAVPDVIEAPDAGLASDFEAMPEPAAAADLDEFVIEPPPVPPRALTPPAPTPRVSMPAVPTPRVSTPAVTPPRSPFTPPRAPFAAPRPTAVPPTPPAVQPPVQPPRPSMMAPFAPPAVPPRPASPASPASPAPPAAPPRPSMLSPMPPVAPRITQPRTITSQPFAPPVIPPQAPKPPVTTPAAPPPVTPLAATPIAPVPSVVPPRSTVPTPISATPSDGVARRAPNPFLANDPNQKGKRLARALVSDMVAYLPQKREEGLKNNTLKQLFREEIKKSYEEYVDQIGKEFAESTTHFQDALNDVLAGGKKIF